MVGRVLLAVALAAVSGGCRRSKLPPRPDGASVVLVADAGVEPNTPSVAEHEPNDTTATAQRLTLEGDALAVTGTAGGTSGKARDADLFRVAIPAAGADAMLRRRLAITLQPDEHLYASLEAMDDLGHALISVSGTATGEQIQVPNLAVTPGTYLFRVRGGGSSAGKYRVLFRMSSLEAGEELEPNGKSTLAGELQPGSEVAGYFGWKRDEDWYRVPSSALGEGGVLSLTLEGVDGVSGSITTYDSSERRLVEQRGRKGDRVVVRNLGVPAGDPFVYVVVRADSGFNTDVRYRLEARADVAAAGSEVEPNDEPRRATVVGDGSWSAFMVPRDVDLFRFAPTSPVELSIDATPPERVDLRLEILHEDGRVAMKVDQGKRREPERVANLFVDAPVLLRFSASRDDGNVDEPYRFTLASRPPEPGAEREPNGGAATATVLREGDTGTGLIFPRTDVDFWRVDAHPDADGTIPITVAGIDGSILELQVSSLGGKELARMKIGPEPAPASLRVMPGAERCCVLQLREPSGRLADQRDRYTVTVGGK